MKKIITIVLFIAILALLVSCKPVTKAPAIEEEAESVEIEEDIAEIDDLEVDIGLEELESLEQDLENLI